MPGFIIEQVFLPLQVFRRPAVVEYAGQVMWQAYQQQKHRPLRSIRLLCSEVS